MLLRSWAVRIGVAILIPTGIVGAESEPQRVANPYYASVTGGPTTASVTTTAPSVRYEVGTPGERTVYPAQTTNAWSEANGNGEANRYGAAPTTVRALPSNRVAALGAALQVAKLNEAYRAGVAATTAPSAEPPRFAPASNTAPLANTATSASTVSASNMPATIKPTATSGYRHDTAVQSVVWYSDLAQSRAPLANIPASQAAPFQAAAPQVAESTAQQVPVHQVPAQQQSGNPLRAEMSTPSASPIERASNGLSSGAIGNPLR